MPGRLSPESAIRQLARRSGGVATARERLLAEVFVLFYAQGVRAVGIDLVIERSGVAKATFYRHFPSKNDLIMAYVRRRQEAWLAWLTAEVDRRAVSACDQLLAIFDALADLCADSQFRGCAANNAVVEIAPEYPRILEAATEYERALSGYVGAIATEAGCRHPAEIAQQWMLLIDGASVGAQRSPGPQSARAAGAMAKALLESEFSASG